MDKKNQRSVSEESGQCPLWTLDNIVYEFLYVIVRIFWNDAQKEMKKKTILTKSLIINSNKHSAFNANAVTHTHTHTLMPILFCNLFYYYNFGHLFYMYSAHCTDT